MKRRQEEDKDRKFKKSQQGKTGYNLQNKTGNY